MSSGTLTHTLGGSFCGLCQGTILWDEGNAESVCTSCGAVSTAPLQVFADLVRKVGIDEGRLSGKGEAVLGSIGANTIVGGRDVDGKGRSLSKSREIYRLRRLDTFVTWDSKRRRLAKVSTEIQRIAGTLGMSSTVAERAFEIYSKEFDAKSMKAKSLSAVAAASLLAACRELEIARPASEAVAELSGVNRKQLRRYYNYFVSNEATVSVSSPSSHISSIAAKTSLVGAIERAALEILAKTKDHPDLVGKRPSSIAAAALYLAAVRSGGGTTQLRLAYASGVTPITIRKRSAELSKILETCA